MRILVLCLTIGGLLASAAAAEEACKAPATCGQVETCGNSNHCGRCGCSCPCEKHCRVVCEMKEVKKTVWAVHCEDFCAPLPSCGHKGCEGCPACQSAEEAACGEGNCKRCDPCASEKSKCIVPPKCGKVRERKKLEKKEVVCKVPSYKCVVVYCCPQCGVASCDAGQAAPAAPAKLQTAPPAPMPNKATVW